MRKSGTARLILAALFFASALAGQSILVAQRSEFEVASVKRNTSNGAVDSRPRRSGDLVMMHNTQPYTVIFYAYKLTANYQIEGYVPLPDGWNWYDIDTRAPSGATDDEIPLMLQSLLADRFKLKVHRETKQVTGFDLIVDKGNAKLQPSGERPPQVTIEGKTMIQTPGTCAISLWRDGSHLVCRAATMDKIVSLVSAELKAPVVDRTALTGTYDVHVHFLPDERKLDADPGPVASLANALREELGLRLEKSKASVDVLVIDHMEKPSDN